MWCIGSKLSRGCESSPFYTTLSSDFEHINMNKELLKLDDMQNDSVKKLKLM